MLRFKPLLQAWITSESVSGYVPAGEPYYKIQLVGLSQRKTKANPFVCSVSRRVPLHPYYLLTIESRAFRNVH